jgi:hypothetical protein
VALIDDDSKDILGVFPGRNPLPELLVFEAHFW